MHNAICAVACYISSLLCQELTDPRLKITRDHSAGCFLLAPGLGCVAAKNKHTQQGVEFQHHRAIRGK